MTIEGAEPLRKRDSHLWARDPNDWYVEPEWCSERLFQMEQFEGPLWDPAAGMGRIVCRAVDAGYEAHGTDIAPKHATVKELSFFDAPLRGYPISIVSNPPFKHAENFVRCALTIAQCKVAMLLPTKWIQGEKRARWLAGTPLRRVWFLCPRPSMPPGRAILAGLKPGNGTTDFAWFVWERDFEGHPEIRWLHRDDGGAA